MADYSLALGVRPLQLEDPLTAYSKFAAIQNAQTQNALVQQQLATARRAEAKDIERTNALASAGTDDTAISNALLATGDLEGYSKFNKSRRETLKADTELVTEKLKQSRLFLDTIDPDNPDAPRQYLAWHESNHKDPVLGPLLASRGITADQARGRIEQALRQGPQAFAQLLMQSKLGTEEFIKQNAPKFFSQGTGNETRLISVPGLGGAADVVPGSVASMQLTPNELALRNRPVSVAPGATLVNPKTGAVIFTGPAAPAQEPPEVKLLRALGLPVTLEGIAQLKQAEAQTGTSQEPIEVRLLRAVGLPVTPEGLKQLREAQTGASQEPNEIKMLRAVGLPVTPEGLKQLREAQTVVSQDPKDPIIRQYEYAKAQGFVGSLFDFKRKLSEAGRPISTSGGGGGGSSGAGKPPSGYRFTPTGDLEPIPGGPASPGLSAKDIQKREAAYPQATQSVNGFEAKSDLFIKELEKLRDDPGLANITGPVFGRTPSITREGSRAQATYDKIFAKGGFQALQDMREMSKTGGALGNVSNEEGRRLERSVVGGLDRTQNIKDVKQGINDLIEEIRGSKARVREAYDSTYEYRAGTSTAAPAAPAAPAAAPTGKKPLSAFETK
jgi:hypothetical protein